MNGKYKPLGDMEQMSPAIASFFSAMPKMQQRNMYVKTRGYIKRERERGKA